MTIIKQGDLTTVTVSPEAEKRMIEFERQAIEQNMVVQQHGASMLEQKSEKPVVKTSAASPLEIYRLMKKIAGVSETSIPSTVEFQPHVASTTEKSAVTNNKQNNNNNNNLVLRNLMKRIANSASPFSP
jgi:hypothetical protein